MRFAKRSGLMTAAGPILFGSLFLGPLIDQSMQALGIQAPGSLTTLQLGLIVGLSLGIVAALRGRWV